MSDLYKNIPSGISSELFKISMCAEYIKKFADLMDDTKTVNTIILADMGMASLDIRQAIKSVFATLKAMDKFKEQQ